MKERVEHDIWYVDNWSLLLDVQIVLRAAVEVMSQLKRVSKLPERSASVILRSLQMSSVY
jgi:lipopolysaccharide/colanic/teichoic acid biosynthesis glycosyltransferase